MFGFSLPKLMLLAFLLVAVWYIFKLIERRDEVRKREEIERAAEAAVRDNVERKKEKKRKSAAETIACTVCGNYVPSEGVRSCGREKCPYPDA